MASQRYQEESYLADPIDGIKDENVDNRLRHRVEVQSMQIERILSEYQVPAHLEGGTISRERINFNLRTHMNSGIERLRVIKDDLIAALGVSDVGLKREKGSVKLVIKRNVPHPVDLLDLLELEQTNDRDYLPGVEAILGLDDDGRSVTLNLAMPDVNNVLVAGTDGAGKSSLLRTMIVSMAIKNRQSDVQIGIVSAGSLTSRLVAKPDPLYPMNYLPHLLFPVVSGYKEAIEALEFMVDEIRYRQEENLESPILILIIDDADLLLSKGGSAFGDPLLKLLDTPPEAGLRTILSATDPLSSGLAPMLKHNLPLRIIGRVKDEQEAYALTAQPESGASYLNGQGDFLAVSYRNVLRFHSAYIDDYDLHLTLTGLHRGRKGALLARPLNNEGIETNSNGGAGEVSFAYDGMRGQASFTQHRDKDDITTGEVLDESNNDADEDNGKLPDWRNGENQAKQPYVENESSLKQVFKQDYIDDSKPVIAAGPRIVAASGSNANVNLSLENLDQDESAIHSIQSELEYSDLDEDEWLPDSKESQSSRMVNRPH